MHLLIVHLFCLRHKACCVVSSYWGLGIVQHGGQRLGMDQRLVQPSAFFDRRESSYWLCGSNWSKHWRTWWAWVWAEKNSCILLRNILFLSSSDISRVNTCFLISEVCGPEIWQVCSSVFSTAWGRNGPSEKRSCWSVCILELSTSWCRMAKVNQT